MPLKNISQLIAHIGIGLLIIGATGTSILKRKDPVSKSKSNYINFKL